MQRYSLEQELHKLKRRNCVQMMGFYGKGAGWRHLALAPHFEEGDLHYTTLLLIKNDLYFLKLLLVKPLLLDLYRDSLLF